MRTKEFWSGWRIGFFGALAGIFLGSCCYDYFIKDKEQTSKMIDQVLKSNGNGDITADSLRKVLHKINRE